MSVFPFFFVEDLPDLFIGKSHQFHTQIVKIASEHSLATSQFRLLDAR